MAPVVAGRQQRVVAVVLVHAHALAAGVGGHPQTRSVVDVLGVQPALGEGNGFGIEYGLV